MLNYGPESPPGRRTRPLARFRDISFSIARTESLIYHTAGAIWGIIAPRYEVLQPNCFRTLCRYPASQIVRQRGVNPVAASTQDLNFTAWRQCKNAVCSVRGRQPRLHAI